MTNSGSRGSEWTVPLLYFGVGFGSVLTPLVMALYAVHNEADPTREVVMLAKLAHYGAAPVAIIAAVCFVLAGVTYYRASHPRTVSPIGRTLSGDLAAQGVKLSEVAQEMVLPAASLAYNRALRLGLTAPLVELPGLAAGCVTRDDATAAREVIADLDRQLDVLEKRRAEVRAEADRRAEVPADLLALPAARAKAQASLLSSLDEIAGEVTTAQACKEG